MSAVVVVQHDLALVQEDVHRESQRYDLLFRFGARQREQVVGQLVILDGNFVGEAAIVIGVNVANRLVVAFVGQRRDKDAELVVGAAVVIEVGDRRIDESLFIETPKPEAALVFCARPVFRQGILDRSPLVFKIDNRPTAFITAHDVQIDVPFTAEVLNVDHFDRTVRRVRQTGNRRVHSRVQNRDHHAAPIIVGVAG